MKVFFNVLLALTFISKYFLHYYLAKLNNRQLSLAENNPDFFEYMWFYTKTVSTNTVKLKWICNALYAIFLISVIGVMAS